MGKIMHKGVNYSNSAERNKSLNDLADVVISSPVDGQTLVYNGTTQQWENKAVSATVANSVVCGSNSITFGVDAQGNYGYIKPGADTVTPFKQVTTREEPNAAGGNTLYIDIN